MSIFESDAIDRIILLGGDVEETNVSQIIVKILQINEFDASAETELIGYIREPIKLIINSIGGSIYDGLGLIDCMDSSVTPIHTVCYGSAMSMGLIILICGHHRSAGRYSTIMYHEGWYGTEGKIENHKHEIKESLRIQKICDDIVFSKSRVTKKAMNAVKSNNSDWYIGAEEALRLNIIDEIIKVKE